MWQFLFDDLVVQVLLNRRGVVQLVYVVADVGFQGVAQVTTFEDLHQHLVAMHLPALSDVHDVLALN